MSRCRRNRSARHSWNPFTFSCTGEPLQAAFIGQPRNRPKPFEEGSCMRAYRFVLAPVLVIGGLLLQHAARSEEYRGTLEQQLACTPDVWRLCAAQIPDAERIVACLQANTPQLSDGCRAV